MDKPKIICRLTERQVWKKEGVFRLLGSSPFSTIFQSSVSFGPLYSYEKEKYCENSVNYSEISNYSMHL